MTNETMGPVLIIAGMHRSGTSFVSSLLKESGLNVGERLTDGAAANAKGFFENIDFVRLHANILKDQGLNPSGWTLEEKIDVSADYRKLAKTTVLENSQPSPWGWKDPRTTLFLDFWDEQLPGAKYLFVFRSPWEIVDSLFRRGDKTFQDDPALAVKVWEHYNRLALRFYSQHRDQCLFVHVDQIAKNPQALIESINQKFALQLTPAASTFDQSLFRKEPATSHRPLLIREFFPSSFKIWEELKATAQIQGADIEPQSASLPDFGDQILFDWLALRKSQSTIKNLEKELEQSKAELDASNQQLEAFGRSRIWQVRHKLVKIRKLLF
ncbi:MAG: sulfotransferase [Candidatus Melainabacteria bacterium]|nr:sulfotransferase [Candidatus Melainabacteria bacterium]